MPLIHGGAHHRARSAGGTNPSKGRMDPAPAP
jgi:hypothetical protein